MRPFRRIIALAARCEIPSSAWGRPCPRTFLQRNQFVESWNDSAELDRRSRDNNKRIRILYSSLSLLKRPTFLIQFCLVEELEGVPTIISSRFHTGINRHSLRNSLRNASLTSQ